MVKGDGYSFSFFTLKKKKSFQGFSVLFVFNFNSLIFHVFLFAENLQLCQYDLVLFTVHVISHFSLAFQFHHAIQVHAKTREHVMYVAACIFVYVGKGLVGHAVIVSTSCS